MAIDLPRHEDFMLPILRILADRGGSATNEEIDTALAEKFALTPAQMEIVYETTGALIAPDRMSWARSYLKYPGFIDNPKRGVWVLTEDGRFAAAANDDAAVRKAVATAYNAQQSRKAAERKARLPGTQANPRVTMPTGPTVSSPSCNRSNPMPSNACASGCCANMASPGSR